jgi:hypothetical protein
VAAAWSDCGLPGRIEATDCDEYPCAAALRMTDTEAAAFPAAADACARTRAWENVEFYSVDVHCPDGTTQKARVVLHGDLDRLGFASVDAALILIGRRMDAAVRMWDCDAH